MKSIYLNADITDRFFGLRLICDQSKRRCGRSRVVCRTKRRVGGGDRSHGRLSFVPTASQAESPVESAGRIGTLGN